MGGSSPGEEFVRGVVCPLVPSSTIYYYMLNPDAGLWAGVRTGGRVRPAR